MDRILILDTMLEQAKESAEIFTKIRKNLVNIQNSNEAGHSILDYLKKHNGKKIRNAEHVWKYRLTRGERVLYTYGKYVEGIREEDNGSIVLLAYSKHNEQMILAQSVDFNSPHKSTDIVDIIDDNDELDELTETEVEIIEDISLPFNQQNVHHRILVAPDEVLKTINESELDVYLSEEQYEIIQSFCSQPEPTLVLGGAGTGKSMIALHILARMAPETKSNSRAAYFTQSAELRRNSQERYKNISGNENIDPNIDFIDIATFCMDQLNYSSEKRKKYIDQFTFVERFPNYFTNKADTKLKKDAQGIDWIKVWTEIRGIIKGQLDSKWCRTSSYPQNEVPTANYLVKNSWLQRDPLDPRRLILYGTVEDLRKRLKKETPKHGDLELHKLLDYFDSVDPHMHSMSNKDYLSLSDEDSTVQKNSNERILVWRIYEIYEAFLKDTGSFDGNDLVCEVLLQKDDLQRYSFIAVDEVQDYTELQIYLAYTLCSNHSMLLFVGDGNQNVNPTLFRPYHMKQLFASDGFTLNEKNLQKNYRCPDTVIRITNDLADLRSNVIAKQHKEQEQPEDAIRKGAQPYRLEWNSDNLQKTLLALSNYPSTALLVPDIATKAKMLSIARKVEGIGETPFIYTVSEIKGMEYTYVVCCNLISRYKQIWDMMLSRNKKSYLTGERLYFNLLYVAMTRSQRYLGFIDEETSSGLEEKLSLQNISIWDDDALHYVDLKDTPIGWLYQAQQSERDGRYDDAILFYKRANADPVHIRRCNAKQAVDRHEYDTAFRLALLSADANLIAETAEHALKAIPAEQVSLYQLCYYLTRDRVPGLQREKTPKALSEVLDKAIETEYCNYTKDERDTVKQFLTDYVDNRIIGKIEAIENWLLERM